MPPLTRSLIRLHICLPTLAIVVLVPLFLSMFAAGIHGQGDEGLIVYPAERILAGQVPYRDFFSELAPGSFYIQALWYKVFGIQIWSVRLPVLIVMCVIAWQLYFIGQKLTTAWAATMPVLIYSVVALSRWVVASYHWYSLSFALAGTMVLIGFLHSRKRFLVFFAGLCTAACGLCMQSKGAFILLGFVAVLVLDYLVRRQRNWRLLLALLTSYFSGVLLPIALFLYYFHQASALDELWYSTFTYLWQRYLPFEFQGLPFLPLDFWQSIGSESGDLSMSNFGKLLSKMAFSLLVPIIAVMYVLRDCRASKPFTQEHSRRQLTMVSCLILGLCLSLSEMHRYDFMHILFGMPLLLVLAVAWMHEIGFRRAAPSRLCAMLLIGITLFYAGNGLSLAWRESRRSAAIYTRRGMLRQAPLRAERYQLLIGDIQSRVEPGSPALLYPYSSFLYFLTGISNPTRFDYLLPGETTPDQFAEVIDVLRGGQAPQWVFSFWKARRSLAHLFPSASSQDFASHPVEDLLLQPEGPYQKVFEAEEYIVFKRKLDRLADSRMSGGH